jgi:YVTN family beta-propeller protein
MKTPKFLPSKAVFLAALALVAAACLTGSRAFSSPVDDDDRKENVGFSNSNHIVLPVNQILSPAGLQVELPGSRPQVIALSPDGRLLAVAANVHHLILVDAASGAVLQNVPFPSDSAREEGVAVSPHILAPDTKGQGSYTGLVFSKDGTRVYLSNPAGSVKVFGVGAGRKVAGLYSIRVAGGESFAAKEIPAGLALSGDGKSLFVVLNLSNRLVEIDLATGQPRRFFDCGMAPYQVVLRGRKAYVSNWGGRRPEAGTLTGPAGKGTLVRVDPVFDAASEGSVTVIGLDAGLVQREIMTGRHASGTALSPDGRFLAVANAASDTVSVIETGADQIIETIPMKWRPRDPFGASPNALVFDPRGRSLYVCNGTQNAVAVVGFKPGKSRLLGFIPVGWFPGDIVFDRARNRLCVANIKGLGSGRRFGPGGESRYNSRQYFGSLSLVPVPDKKTLSLDTAVVFADYRRRTVEASQLPPRAGAAARPVPERAGEPSLHKHVIYIIKENRTYDQVLGDMPEGNGAPGLCIFGARVTPNQHKMCRDFALLDNTHCSGILSADGHQWADTGIATDYMEKSFAGFPRSYPDGMEAADVDALAYSPAGFIWDNALAHGKTLRDYGEFTMGRVRWTGSAGRRAPGFLDCYNDFIKQTGLIDIQCVPSVRSLGPHIMTNTIGWALEVPDVFRAAQFIKELREFEKAGELPELIIICLPNDHTSGTAAGAPTPAAQAADNDLAFGRIVEAVSHSRFWRDTCIFAIEDDPQAGPDHVDSYRTTAYVISPYVRRHAVVKSNYNHTSILRTLELMLGLPPMNQMDASASPMSDCFSGTPDFTPFDAVPNNIPLDQMNPPASAIANPVLRNYAVASSKLPLDEADQCPEDLLNRILWAAQKGPDVPYPTWAATKPPK